MCVYVHMCVCLGVGPMHVDGYLCVEVRGWHQVSIILHLIFGDRVLC